MTTRDTNVCRCGTGLWYEGGRQAHAFWHLDWAIGVPLRGPRPGTVRVPADGPADARKVAHRLARLMRLEMGYDLPLFPAARGRGQRPTAYLAIRSERAVGLVVMNETSRWGWFDQRDEHGAVLMSGDSPAVSVVGVFTCGDMRRQGSAAKLVRDAAASEHQRLGDLVWTWPFSKDGLRLVQSLVGNDHFRVG